MEDQVQIINNSILKNIVDVKPIKIKDSASGVTHTVLHSKKGGFSSVGSDYDEETSFYKARNELIERLIYNELKSEIDSTSGLSAHFDDKLAKESSYKELVERDLFLTSWFSGYFPKWDNPLSKDFPFDKYEKQFDIKIGHIGQSNEFQCFVFVVTDKKKRFGSICGTVCEKSSSDIIKKIVYDVSRISLFTSKNINYINSQNKPGFHYNHYLNIKNTYIPNTYINESSEPINLDTLDYHFTLFRFCKKTLFPISISLCTSPNVQSYFSGIASADKINKKRISNPIHPDRLVHPLG